MSKKTFCLPDLGEGGGMETHRMMPLSLTFDHRAVTGGEAARFLRVMIDDLQRAH